MKAPILLTPYECKLVLYFNIFFSAQTLVSNYTACFKFFHFFHYVIYVLLCFGHARVHSTTKTTVTLHRELLKFTVTF